MPSSAAKLTVRPLAVLFHVSLLYAFEAVDFPDASGFGKVITSQLFPTKSQEKTGASKEEEEEEQDSLIKLAEMSLKLASARRRRRTAKGTDGEPTRRSIEEETEGEPAKKPTRRRSRTGKKPGNSRGMTLRMKKLEAHNQKLETRIKKLEKLVTSLLPKPTSNPKSKPTPKSAPKSTPKSAPKSTPKSAPKSTPKSAPKSTPKSAPKSTPKATPKPKPRPGPVSKPDRSPTKQAPTKKPDGSGFVTRCGSRCSEFFVRCAKRNANRLPQGQAYTLCRDRMTVFTRWQCTAGCADTPAMAAFKGKVIAPTPGPTTKAPTAAPPAPAKKPPPTAAPPAPTKKPPPSPTAPGSQLDTFPYFDEDACAPALGEVKHKKCNGRGHLVSSTTYNYTGGAGQIVGAKVLEVRSTKEYCGRCDWPYYGRWCQLRRPDQKKYDLVIVVESLLQSQLAEEIKTYVNDLKAQNVTAEVFTMDLPVVHYAGAYRELRRLLMGEWKFRGPRAAFLIGHFPSPLGSINCAAWPSDADPSTVINSKFVGDFMNRCKRPNPADKKKYEMNKNKIWVHPTLGYFMHFKESYPKSAGQCSKPGGIFIPPKFQFGKTMELAVGVLNHLTIGQYKSYFEKVHRWRKGGNKFFDVGPGTGNKPLINYADIGSNGDIGKKGSDGTFGMGEAFEFPRDFDHWRSARTTMYGERKKDSPCRYTKDKPNLPPPAKNCIIFKECKFTDKRAFFPSGYGSKPSIIDGDKVDGTQYLLVRWTIHGSAYSTKCFGGEELENKPFLGGSFFFMHSCSSSKHTVKNLGSTVTTMKYGLNSLGTGKSGSATDPWLYVKFLREGKDTGEALMDWWHGRMKGIGQDGYGQWATVLYGDPVLKYSALSRWERKHPRNEKSVAGEMTEEEKKEMDEFEEEGDMEDDVDADTAQEDADEAQHDAQLED